MRIQLKTDVRVLKRDGSAVTLKAGKFVNYSSSRVLDSLGTREHFFAALVNRKTVFHKEECKEPSWL